MYHSWQIVMLDLARRVALARVTNEQYYTDSQDISDVNVLSRSRSCLGQRTHFGRVQSFTHVYGYRKIWKKSGKLFDTCDVSMPPHEFASFGMWTDVPLPVKLYLDSHGMDFLGSVHGAAHAVIAALPSFVLCDRSDVGTECYQPLQRRARPMRMILFDRRPGGIGIASAAFDRAADLYTAALQLLECCPCTEGCPSCCHDPACAGFNLVIDKPGAIIILRSALGLFPPGIELYLAGGGSLLTPIAPRAVDAAPPPASHLMVDPLTLASSEVMPSG